MSVAAKPETAQFSQEKVKADLLKWWKSEAEERNAFAGELENMEKGTVYDILPQVDSLTVVRSFVALEILLKIEIPCETVKRGGYCSPEEFVDDLLPKLKDLFEKRYGKHLT